MRKLQSGDTIIEVLFAVSVFSLIAVGAVLIMNQGISSAQKALEITQVRQQIDAQAEALRYAHHSYVMSIGTDTGGSAEWGNIRARAKAPEAITVFGNASGSSLCDDVPEGAFVMNARTGMLSMSVEPRSISSSQPGYSSPPYAKVTYNGNQLIQADGIWIEAAASAGSGGIGYTDFHIRACWESPGAGPAMTLGTIVRLYEPAL